MPPMQQHISSSVTKLLLIGDSGAGKTGALASLAQAGYNLRIIDLDNGLDVLSNYAQSSTYGGPETLKRIEYETLTDTMKSIGGKLVPAKATVWKRATDLLINWKTPTADFGPLTSWGPQDILVIDSLSFLAIAALNHILAMNARLGGKPEQGDWYQGQQLLEGMLQAIYDENVRCNVVITTHLAYIGAENGPQTAYPAALGKALSPKIGRYFNSVLMAKTTGSGANQKRRILTGTTGIVELKNTAPMRVKPEYDLSTGLADYFRDVRGQAAKA